MLKNAKIEKQQGWLMLLVIFFGLLVIILVLARIHIPAFGLSSASRGRMSSTLYFSPPTHLSDRFIANVLLDTDGNAVVAVDAKIRYNPEHVLVHKVQKHPDSPFTSYPLINHDNNGLVQIGANAGASNDFHYTRGNEIKIAIIEYSIIHESAHTLFSYAFEKNNRNDSNVVLLPQKEGDVSVDILTSVRPLTVDSKWEERPDFKPLGAPKNKNTVFENLYNRLFRLFVR